MAMLGVSAPTRGVAHRRDEPSRRVEIETGGMRGIESSRSVSFLLRGKGFPPVLILGWVGICFLPVVLAADGGEETAPSAWHYQFYLDAGYAYSNNQPANGLWRSKSTTSTLDELDVFLAMGNGGKHATPDSRWGFEFGLQAGDDSAGLVTAPPPPAYTPIDNADSWRHLYRANLSYLFDAGRGLRLTGGLINSYIGYESYLAIDNPNYTRGYLLDTVPYFMIGLEAVWDVSDELDMGFYLTSGYNYLTNPNDVPSTGLQIQWRISPRTTFTQNLYYGPDQADTSIEFWRFLSDTIVEWKKGRFLLAAAVDVGTERQAHLPGQPRHEWSSGAVWARWQFAERWSVALRPEFFRDRDGQITGAQQFIRAGTGTVKYQFSPRRQRLVGTFEVRYDRSTGDQGGFYEGPDNDLVPDQTLALVGILWSLDH
jgi:hypothetical protein